MDSKYHKINVVYMYVHVPLFFTHCSCQVLCAIFDEASVNHCLANLQDTHAKLLYKVPNILNSTQFPKMAERAGLQ